VLKGKATPVPGIVIEASASGLKVAVTQAAKTTDFIVSLKTPMACSDVMKAGSDVNQLKSFILTNGATEDTGKIEALSPDYKRPVSKITVEGTVSAIKVAVTQDAKDARIPDFIVNLKEPATCKEVMAAGTEFGLQAKGEAELDGTYDSYTKIPATATMTQTAQIVLRDGSVVPEKKKPVPHKPSPVHRAPAQ